MEENKEKIIPNEKPDIIADLKQIAKDGFELMQLEGEYDKSVKENKDMEDKQ